MTMYQTPQTSRPSGVPLPPPNLPFTAEIASQINEASNAVNSIASIARGTADAIFGATSETSVGQGAVGTPSARADAVRVALQDLHSQIAALRTQVERLTCV